MLMPGGTNAAAAPLHRRHEMTHARRTGHHFLRNLHPSGWLKDTRDQDYAVGKLIAPSQLARRNGSVARSS
jgi:hypothetical protein